MRGFGYFGFAVDGEGEVEILDFEIQPGNNKENHEGLDAYIRPCEWCVVKDNQQNFITLTFALRIAK